jgi:hypothetical protein
MPLDPAREWLAAGITGLARGREWDAVVLSEAPGTVGEELEFVALSDGRLLAETGDATPFADALAGALEPPYRAVAVRRVDVWAVGACRIEVVRLDPDPKADDLELTWDGTTLALLADGAPAGTSQGSGLERIASGRERGGYAAQAHRLAGDLWEISVRPL